MSTKTSTGRVRPTYEFIKGDRGQFSVQMMCRVLGVAPSGNCWDNAIAESFFSRLKKERIKKQTHKNEPRRSLRWPVTSIPSTIERDPTSISAG